MTATSSPDAAPVQEARRDDGLAGRVAVITGGASGIGRALALAYARAGVASVLGYHPGDPHDAGKVVAEVEAAGGRACAVAADVRDSEQVDALMRTAVERFGRLDIAVAGAGVLRRAPLAELSDDAWDDMLSVDLTGVLRTLRAAAGAMTGPEPWSRSPPSRAASTAGTSTPTTRPPSPACSACAGPWRWSWRPAGIRVNAVIPGLIESPQSLDPVNSLGPEGLADAGRLIPWGRVGTADEAARTIRFLTGDDAGYVTGQQLIVDGGLTVRWPS